MTVAIALVLVVVGGAIWYFMAKSDQSGPDRLSEVTPGQPKHAMMSGGGGGGGSAPRQKQGGAAAQ